MPSFVPSREADLVTWSNNFDRLINMNAVSYGLTIEQAAAYTVLHNAFAAAFQTANDSSTRTPSAIVTKNDSKEALIEDVNGIRALVGIIQEFPGTTNTMRSDLEITVRDYEPTPVPTPGTAPVMSIVSTFGRTVKVRLRDAANPTNRGKPTGVAGATVLSYVGDDPPADPLTWSFLYNKSQTTFDVEYPATIPAGSKVWLTAFWFNPRQKSGPAAAPVTTRIAEGLAQAA